MKQIALLFGLCLILACGGGGSAPLAVKTMKINQSGSTLAPGATQQFTTDAGEPVSWSADRGTIDAAGLYTAPATLGPDTVTAKLVSDPNVEATGTVGVQISRDVLYTVRNDSAGVAVIDFGALGSGDLQPGQTINHHGTNEWTEESTVVHQTAVAKVTGQPDVTASIDLTVADARNPAFTGCTAVFDGTQITITKN